MTLRALWATPRTVSTAFERMIIERGDHLVFDEPWSRAYYFGPDRRSDRYPLVFPESGYAAVTSAVVRQDWDRPVFVKGMAYQAEPGLSDDDLRDMVHTFLIREPAAALRSLGREWPDHTEDEAGYLAQRRLFDRVIEVTGQVPLVLDSDALRRDPEAVVSAWCAAVGIEHRPDSLTWAPGMRPEWPLWNDWYRRVAASSGFAPPEPSREEQTPPPSGVLERAITAHQHLARHVMRSPE